MMLLWPNGIQLMQAGCQADTRHSLSQPLTHNHHLLTLPTTKTTHEHMCLSRKAT